MTVLAKDSKKRFQRARKRENLQALVNEEEGLEVQRPP